MTQKQYNLMLMKEYARQQKKYIKERDKLTQEHSEYLQRDIEEIYSALICVLHNSGVEDEKIIELINAISAEWTYHVEHRDERGDVSMADYCRELTGIDIRDMQHFEQ